MSQEKRHLFTIVDISTKEGVGGIHMEVAQTDFGGPGSSEGDPLLSGRPN